MGYHLHPICNHYCRTPFQHALDEQGNPIQNGKNYRVFCFLRKLCYCKTSLQLRNVRHLNSVNMLDFDQLDQSSIFMLKNNDFQINLKEFRQNSVSHIQFWQQLLTFSSCLLLEPSRVWEYFQILDTPNLDSSRWLLVRFQISYGLPSHTKLSSFIKSYFFFEASLK